MDNYKIDMKDGKNPVLLTKSILYKVIESVKKSKKEVVKVEIGALVETQYMKYLVEIFRSNQEFLAAYHMLSTTQVNVELISRIFQLQFLLLTMNEKKCFEKVKVTKNNPDTVIQYWFQCSPAFYCACQKSPERFDLSIFG